MKHPRLKLSVLDEDDAVTADRPAPEGQLPADDARLVDVEVDVVSDVICPWCYVGKRRLERAMQLLADRVRFRVRWRPFQLNPSMPKEGIDRRAYRTAKFGSWEQSQTLDARLAAVGKEEGIEFAFERMVRTPNTLDAHRLIWLAGRLGVQDAVVEALFRAYFEEGIDVGRQETLIGIATSAGVGRTDAERLLLSDEGARDVLAEEDRYKAMGISGVPAFVVNDTVVVSGATHPRVMAEGLLAHLAKRQL